ncbi:MAG: mechanosensitive ion channel family protein, partial [Proteobacteria bacterium]
RIDDLFVILIEKTTLPFIFSVFLYFALRSLKLPEGVVSALNHLIVFGAFVQVGFWAGAGLRFYSVPYTTISEKNDAGRVTTMRALFFLGNIIVWIGVALLILDNWGIKISALVAGLGIGGVAVALAVQNILGDLFASLSIVFDKPFVIGDAIRVDGDQGNVEHIGLKTTRVKSLTGEQLIFSNSDLLRSRVRNYKRQDERRVVISIGVLYETPAEKLAAIPQILRGYLEGVKNVRFERAHLMGFGPSSLNYELVYWVTVADYNYHMDVQQKFMLQVIERFAAEGIEFAYPTQKLFLQPMAPAEGALNAERSPASL